MSLTSQLRAIRSAQGLAAVQSPQKARGRASFLFDAREAAEINADTVFGIASNGLRELTKLDERFETLDFESRLFSSAKVRERALLTEQENRALSASISEFLRLLSPHFLLKPAHKTLEFLVRMYRIHEYDVDAVVECIVPYHDTPVFARMVQLLEISAKSSGSGKSKWRGLRRSQESGAPLDRASIVTMALKDRAVLSFFCEMPRHAAPSPAPVLTSAPGRSSDAAAGAVSVPSRVVAAFYGSVLTEVLAKTPVIDGNILAVICESLLDGLAARHWPAYQAAAYMVMAQLCCRTVLTSRLSASLIEALAAGLSGGGLGLGQGLLALAVVVQTQAQAQAQAQARSEASATVKAKGQESMGVKRLTDAAFRSLWRFDTLLPSLASAARKYDISRLVYLILDHVVFNAKPDADRVEMEDEADSLYLSDLAAALDPAALPLSQYTGVVQGITVSILRRCVREGDEKRRTKDKDKGKGTDGDDADAGKGQGKRKRGALLLQLRSILRQLSVAYPGGVDAGVAQCLAFTHAHGHGPGPGHDGPHSMVGVVESVFGGSLHTALGSGSDSASASATASTTLSAALNHAHPDMRRAGFRQLAENPEVLLGDVTANSTSASTVSSLSTSASLVAAALADEDDVVVCTVLASVPLLTRSGLPLPRLCDLLTDLVLSRRPDPVGLAALDAMANVNVNAGMGVGVGVAVEGFQSRAAGLLMSLMVPRFGAHGRRLSRRALKHAGSLGSGSGSGPGSSLRLFSAIEKHWEPLASAKPKLNWSDPSGEVDVRVAAAGAVAVGEAVAADPATLVPVLEAIPDPGYSVRTTRSLAVFKMLALYSALSQCQKKESGTVIAAALYSLARTHWATPSTGYGVDLEVGPQPQSPESVLPSHSVLQLLCAGRRRAVGVSVMCVAALQHCVALVDDGGVGQSHVLSECLRRPVFQRALMQRVIEALPSHAVLTKGLTSVWVRDANGLGAESKGNAAEAEVEAEAVACVRALSVMCAWVRGVKPRPGPVGDYQAFIPHVLPALRHTVASVRRAALELLDAVSAVHQSKSKKRNKNKGKSKSKGRDEDEDEDEDRSAVAEGMEWCVEQVDADTDADADADVDCSAAASALLKLVLGARADIEQDSAGTVLPRLVAGANMDILPYALTHSRAQGHAPVAVRSALVWLVSAVRPRVITPPIVTLLASALRTEPIPAVCVGLARLLALEPGNVECVAAMSELVGAGEAPSATEAVVGHLTRSFLERVSPASRATLLRALLVRASDISKPKPKAVPASALAPTPTSRLRESVTAALSRVPLDGDSVIPLLQLDFDLDLDHMSAPATTLLLLEHINARGIAQGPGMGRSDVAAHLFGLLAGLDKAESVAESEGGVAVEAEVDYLRQMVLGALCATVAPDVATGAGVDMNVDAGSGSGRAIDVKPEYATLVVKCARRSDNPVTVNHAVLLVSHLAAAVPHAALEALTSMFELLPEGAEDTQLYSVMKRAVTAAVRPALPQVGEEVVRQAFVGALPSMSPHWRIGLLRALVDVLGPHSIAPLVLRIESDGEAGSTSSTALLASLPPVTLLRATAAILGSLAVDVDEDLCGRVVAMLAAVFEAGIDIGAAVEAEAQADSGSEDEDGDEAEDEDEARAARGVRRVEAAVLEAAERALNLVGRVSTVVGGSTSASLIDQTSSLLNDLSSLLSPGALVSAVSGLLLDEDDGVRRTALDALHHRFKDEAMAKTKTKIKTKIGASSDTADKLASVFPMVVQSVSHSAPAVAQSALVAVETITCAIGKTHSVSVSAALPALVEVCTGSGSAVVRAGALVAVGAAVDQMGARMLEHIPVVFPGVLAALCEELASSGSGSEVVVSSALAALISLVGRLSRFAQPYLASMLSRSALLHPAILAHDLAVRIRTMLAESVAARLMVPVLTKAYREVESEVKVETGAGAGRVADALECVLGAISVMIAGMDRPSVAAYGEQLFTFFLHALDFRRLHCEAQAQVQAQVQAISTVEAATVAAFEALVVKITGSAFLPLFVRAVDWATADLNASRLLSLLTLAQALGARLKSIFVPYSATLLDFCIQSISDVVGGAVDGLVTACVRASGSGGGGGKRRRGTSSDGSSGAPADSLLLSVLASTIAFLESVFIHDLDGTVGRDRIERVAPALAGLLAPVSTTGTSIEHAYAHAYAEAVTSPLIRCIGQVAVLAGSDVLWKPIQFHVLMATRSEAGSVRANAVRAMREFYVRLGEEFLVMLPESMSYLAELMEDEDAEVERETRELVGIIEKLLGEPLVLA